MLQSKRLEHLARGKFREGDAGMVLEGKLHDHVAAAAVLPVRSRREQKLDRLIIARQPAFEAVDQ